jgi:threonine dehydratase
MTRMCDISISSIEDAAKRIREVAFRTPLFYSKHLSKVAGANVYLKLECYQPIRVFKIRGAANKMLKLATSTETKSTVTFSAGNHGLAVAFVAERLGMKSTIVVPETAVEDKVRAIMEYDNVKIIKTGKRVEELRSVAEELVKNEGAAMVHPFSDPDVISGQGTIGLEIYEDLPSVDTVLVPIGGGGLIGGIAVALKAKKRNVKTVGVCADGAPAVYKSYKENRMVSQSPDTIADGMAASTTEPFNLELMRKNVSDIVLVTDVQIKSAMFTMIKDLHILAEAAGAAAVAALLGKCYVSKKKDENIVLVISGGNANTALLRQIICEKKSDVNLLANT